MKTERISFILGIALSVAFSVTLWAYFEHRDTPSSFREPHVVFDSLESLHLRWTDIKYKFIQEGQPNSQVALVAIDDDSVNEIGRWPWSRELVAQMTEEALAGSIKSIAFDVIFSEPEAANPQADLRFGQTIANNTDRVILGTFSETQYPYKPYQDFCVAQAFKASGGESLVKINPSLVVDMPTNSLDELNWDGFFSPLFANLQSLESEIVLKKNNMKAEAELPRYQKNYLQARKRHTLFEFCKVWLTDEDPFLSPESRADVEGHYVSSLGADLKLTKFEDIKKEILKKSQALAVPQYGLWTQNIPELQEPSLFTASFIAQLDADGYVRRYPLFFRSGNQLGLSYVPSLALQSYLINKNYRAEVKLRQDKQHISVAAVSIFENDTDKHVVDIPVDNEGQMLIRYYGRQMSLPYIPAKEFFYQKKTLKVQRSIIDKTSKRLQITETEFDRKEYLKGKSLIVGASAVGLYDLRNTPVEANYPGPEIHLTALDNLMQQKFLKAWPQEKMLFWIVAIVGGVLLSALWSFGGFLFTFVAFFVVLGLALLADFFIFSQLNTVLHSIFILTHIFTLFFVIQLYKYFAEEKKKQEIKNTFSKYVAPALVDTLLKDAENLKLGGRREYMSVFFSDVRGFTTISEKLKPEELSRILNLYLTPMTEIVFKNQGTLDKYMGDAIMAFFGAPVKNATHAADACRCALESIEKLKQIQSEFKALNLPVIDIGIGINTGEMSVGNMGSNIVQSYTVMGDSVNLASRLEGINKEYGTRIIISEFTKAEVGSSFTTREVDLVKVKGKNLPVKIYELICEGEPSTEVAKALGAYQKGLESYRAFQFQQAIHAFKDAIQLFGGTDPVSELYIERSETLLKEPPPQDWDGVFVMKTK